MRETSWTPSKLAVAYDDKLLEWSGSPSSPVRAKLAVEALGRLGVPMAVEAISYSPAAIRDQIERLHDPRYVKTVLDEGISGEWSGKSTRQAMVALHMFAGTVVLAGGIARGEVLVGFSPQGAKHHAQWSQSSGFCVFNDMAWAAMYFSRERGLKVLYIDIDAHHGDGVENLTRDMMQVRTASVHDSSIFPGTGQTHESVYNVYNYALKRGAGDAELLDAVDDILERADTPGSQPDVVLIAAGADGHVSDPLSNLQYTYEGFAVAAEKIGLAAARWKAPVLIGGAGGYQAETHTPLIWATFVSTLFTAYKRSVEERVGATL